MTVDAAALKATLKALEAAKYAIDSKEHVDEVSVKFDVPARTIRRAKLVLRQGVPEVIDVLKMGKMTLTSASELVKLNKRQQKKVLYSNAFDQQERQQKQQQQKPKKLTDDRIANIKRIAEEMKKCCDGSFVSHYGVLVLIKELDEYCDFLLNNKKQPRIVVNVVDIDREPS